MVDKDGEIKDLTTQLEKMTSELEMIRITEGVLHKEREKMKTTLKDLKKENKKKIEQFELVIKVIVISK